MMIKHIRNCICVLLLAAAAFFFDGCSFRPESAKRRGPIRQERAGTRSAQNAKGEPPSRAKAASKITGGWTLQ